MAAAQRRVESLGASVKSVGQSVSGFGMQMAKVGAGAALGLGLAARTSANFEAAMARVKAIKDPTKEQFENMRTAAKKLGADTIFSAAQAAQAMGNFAQAGYSVNEILKATGPALDLAATAQIEIADAASIASKIMKGMGIGVEDLTRVIDVMAKAATTSNTDIMMLGDAFKFVGPYAKIAKISLEEITAAIQLLSDAGIQGEMAGTTMRGVIATLTTPSEKGAKKMAELGIQVNDAKGNVRSLVDIFGQFEKALAGMGTGAKLEAIGTIFPDRQAAGALVLASEGAERLAAATKALGNSAGTAARVAGVQLDILWGSVELVMSSLEGFGNEVGEAITPMVRKFASSIVDLLNTLAKLAKVNQEVVVRFAKLTAGAIALSGALIVTGAALSAVGGAVAFLMTPFGMVTAAVGAIGYAFLTMSTQGQKAIADFLPTIESMKTTALETFGGIAAALKAGDIALAGQIMWAGLKIEWLKGTNYLMSVWEGFKAFVVDIWHGIGFGIQKALISIVARIHTTLATAASKVQEFALAQMGLSQGPKDRKKRMDALDKFRGTVEAKEFFDLSRVEEAQRADQDRGKNALDPERVRRRGEIIAAEEELKKLTGQAEAAQPNVLTATGTATPDKPKAAAVADMVPEAADEIGKGLDAAAKKVEVKGTFSAIAAARGLGVGDTLSDKVEEQRKEQEKTNKLLEKANAKLGNMKGRFV